MFGLKTRKKKSVSHMGTFVCLGFESGATTVLLNRGSPNARRDGSNEMTVGATLTTTRRKSQKLSDTGLVESVRRFENSSE